MEWILLAVLLIVFLWRRYGEVFNRRVSIVEIIAADDEAIVYCSFKWHGRVYQNGYFALEDYHGRKSFFIKGYDALKGLWLLQPL